MTAAVVLIFMAAIVLTSMVICTLPLVLPLLSSLSKHVSFSHIVTVVIAIITIIINIDITIIIVCVIFASIILTVASTAIVVWCPGCSYSSSHEHYSCVVLIMFVVIVCLVLSVGVLLAGKVQRRADLARYNVIDAQVN